MTQRTRKQREAHERREEIKKLREVLANPKTPKTAHVTASARLKKLEETRQVHVERRKKTTQGAKLQEGPDVPKIQDATKVDKAAPSHPPVAKLPPAWRVTILTHNQGYVDVNGRDISPEDLPKYQIVGAVDINRAIAAQNSGGKWRLDNLDWKD
jgi:hypothetical protein